MPTEREQLEITIRGLGTQRALLGDALVDAALQQLRGRLAALGADGAEAQSAQTLRQVTILFLDVVGSTKLSQRLDPEETQLLLDGALERFAAVVGAHGGKILKVAGDSMLAGFGADQAKEDDAERAVRCGLALLETAGRYAAEIKGRYADTAFAIRVGAHTGGVLLGGGPDGDSSIRGSAVNVAARMEQSAPPGRFRISHDTYAHVRGVFDVEPQPPLTVKGIDTPVVTYLVERLKPRAFRVRTRGIEGVETRMIGREAESEVLQDAPSTNWSASSSHEGRGPCRALRDPRQFAASPSDAETVRRWSSGISSVARVLRRFASEPVLHGYLVRWSTGISTKIVEKLEM